MKVSEAMTRNLIVANNSQTIITAKKLMDEKGIRRLPVMDEKKILVGYVTYNSLLRATNLMAPLETVMATELISIAPEEPLTKAIQMMIQQKIGGILVLNQGELQGIITRRDILKRLMGHMNSQQTKNEPWTINNWMSYSPVCFDEEQTINEALEKMIERDIRRVCILDKSGKFVGLITKNRILRAANLKTSLCSIMDTKLEILAPTDTLMQASQIMIDKKISGIPILDHDRLEGILTDTDLLRCYFEILGGDEADVEESRDVEEIKQQYQRELERITSQFVWLSKRLEIMERAIHLFSHIEDLEKNLEQALKLVEDIIPCEAGSILLVDNEKKQFFFSVAFGKNSEKLQDIFIPLEKGIVGACFKEKQIISVSDVRKDPRYYREVSDAVGFETHSLVAIPLITNGNCLGVLELLNKKGSDSFVASELSILEKMACIISNLIQLSLRVAD